MQSQHHAAPSRGDPAPTWSSRAITYLDSVLPRGGHVHSDEFRSLIEHLSHEEEIIQGDPTIRATLLSLIDPSDSAGCARLSVDESKVALENLEKLESALVSVLSRWGIPVGWHATHEAQSQDKRAQGVVRAELEARRLERRARRRMINEAREERMKQLEGKKSENEQELLRKFHTNIESIEADASQKRRMLRRAVRKKLQSAKRRQQSGIRVSEDEVRSEISAEVLRIAQHSVRKSLKAIVWDAITRQDDGSGSKQTLEALSTEVSTHLSWCGLSEEQYDQQVKRFREVGLDAEKSIISCIDTVLAWIKRLEGTKSSSKLHGISYYQFVDSSDVDTSSSGEDDEASLLDIARSATRDDIWALTDLQGDVAKTNLATQHSQDIDRFHSQWASYTQNELSKVSQCAQKATLRIRDVDSDSETEHEISHSDDQVPSMSKSSTRRSEDVLGGLPVHICLPPRKRKEVSIIAHALTDRAGFGPQPLRRPSQSVPPATVEIGVMAYLNGWQVTPEDLASSASETEDDDKQRELACVRSAQLVHGSRPPTPTRTPLLVAAPLPNTSALLARRQRQISEPAIRRALEYRNRYNMLRSLRLTTMTSDDGKRATAHTAALQVGRQVLALLRGNDSAPADQASLIDKDQFAAQAAQAFDAAVTAAALAAASSAVNAAQALEQQAYESIVSNLAEAQRPSSPQTASLERQLGELRLRWRACVEKLAFMNKQQLPVRQPLKLVIEQSATEAPDVTQTDAETVGSASPEANPKQPPPSYGPQIDTILGAVDETVSRISELLRESQLANDDAKKEEAPETQSAGIIATDCAGAEETITGQSGDDAFSAWLREVERTSVKLANEAAAIRLRLEERRRVRRKEVVDMVEHIALECHKLIRNHRRGVDDPTSSASEVPTGSDWTHSALELLTAQGAITQLATKRDFNDVFNHTADMYLQDQLDSINSGKWPLMSSNSTYLPGEVAAIQLLRKQIRRALRRELFFDFEVYPVYGNRTAQSRSEGRNLLSVTSEERWQEVLLHHPDILCWTSAFWALLGKQVPVRFFEDCQSHVDDDPVPPKLTEPHIKYFSDPRQAYAFNNASAAAASQLSYSEYETLFLLIAKLLHDAMYRTEKRQREIKGTSWMSRQDNSTMLPPKGEVSSSLRSAYRLSTPQLNELDRFVMRDWVADVFGRVTLDTVLNSLGTEQPETTDKFVFERHQHERELIALAPYLKASMTFDQFRRSMVELAMTWSRSYHPAEHAAFLRLLFTRTVMVICMTDPEIGRGLGFAHKPYIVQQGSRYIHYQFTFAGTTDILSSPVSESLKRQSEAVATPTQTGTASAQPSNAARDHVNALPMVESSESDDVIRLGVEDHVDSDDEDAPLILRASYRARYDSNTSANSVRDQAVYIHSIAFLAAALVEQARITITQRRLFAQAATQRILAKFTSASNQPVSEGTIIDKTSSATQTGEIAEAPSNPDVDLFSLAQTLQNDTESALFRATALSRRRDHITALLRRHVRTSESTQNGKEIRARIVSEVSSIGEKLRAAREAATAFLTEEELRRVQANLQENQLSPKPAVRSRMIRGAQLTTQSRPPEVLQEVSLSSPRGSHPTITERSFTPGAEAVEAKQEPESVGGQKSPAPHSKSKRSRTKANSPLGKTRRLPAETCRSESAPTAEASEILRLVDELVNGQIAPLGTGPVADATAAESVEGLRLSIEEMDNEGLAAEDSRSQSSKKPDNREGINGGNQAGVGAETVSTVTQDAPKESSAEAVSQASVSPIPTSGSDSTLPATGLGSKADQHPASPPLLSPPKATPPPEVVKACEQDQFLDSLRQALRGGEPSPIVTPRQSVTSPAVTTTPPLSPTPNGASQTQPRHAEPPVVPERSRSIISNVSHRRSSIVSRDSVGSISRPNSRNSMIASPSITPHFLAGFRRLRQRISALELATSRAKLQHIRDRARLRARLLAGADALQFHQTHNENLDEVWGDEAHEPLCSADMVKELRTYAAACLVLRELDGLLETYGYLEPLTRYQHILQKDPQAIMSFTEPNCLDPEDPTGQYLYFDRDNTRSPKDSALTPSQFALLSSPYARFDEITSALNREADERQSPKQFMRAVAQNVKKRLSEAIGGDLSHDGSEGRTGQATPLVATSSNIEMLASQAAAAAAASPLELDETTSRTLATLMWTLLREMKEDAEAVLEHQLRQQEAAQKQPEQTVAPEEASTTTLKSQPHLDKLRQIRNSVSGQETHRQADTGDVYSPTPSITTSLTTTSTTSGSAPDDVKDVLVGSNLRIHHQVWQTLFQRARPFLAPEFNDRAKIRQKAFEMALKAAARLYSDANNGEDSDSEEFYDESEEDYGEDSDSSAYATEEDEEGDRVDSSSNGPVQPSSPRSAKGPATDSSLPWARNPTIPSPTSAPRGVVSLHASAGTSGLGGHVFDTNKELKRLQAVAEAERAKRRAQIREGMHKRRRGHVTDEVGEYLKSIRGGSSEKGDELVKRAAVEATSRATTVVAATNKFIKLLSKRKGHKKQVQDSNGESPMSEDERREAQEREAFWKSLGKKARSNSKRNLHHELHRGGSEESQLVEKLDEAILEMKTAAASHTAAWSIRGSNASKSPLPLAGQAQTHNDLLRRLRQWLAEESRELDALIDVELAEDDDLTSQKSSTGHTKASAIWAAAKAAELRELLPLFQSPTDPVLSSQLTSLSDLGIDVSDLEHKLRRRIERLEHVAKLAAPAAPTSAPSSPAFVVDSPQGAESASSTLASQARRWSISMFHRIQDDDEVVTNNLQVLEKITSPILHPHASEAGEVEERSPPDERPSPASLEMRLLHIITAVLDDKVVEPVVRIQSPSESETVSGLSPLEMPEDSHEEKVAELVAHEAARTVRALYQAPEAADSSEEPGVQIHCYGGTIADYPTSIFESSTMSEQQALIVPPSMQDYQAESEAHVEPIDAKGVELLLRCILEVGEYIGIGARLFDLEISQKDAPNERDKQCSVVEPTDILSCNLYHELKSLAEAQNISDTNQPLENQDETSNESMDQEPQDTRSNTDETITSQVASEAELNETEISTSHDWVDSVNNEAALRLMEGEGNGSDSEPEGETEAEAEAETEAQNIDEPDMSLEIASPAFDPEKSAIHRLKAQLGEGSHIPQRTIEALIAELEVRHLAWLIFAPRVAAARAKESELAQANFAKAFGLNFPSSASNVESSNNSSQQLIHVDAARKEDFWQAFYRRHQSLQDALGGYVAVLKDLIQQRRTLLAARAKVALERAIEEAVNLRERALEEQRARIEENRSLLVKAGVWSPEQELTGSSGATAYLAPELQSMFHGASLHSTREPATETSAARHPVEIIQTDNPERLFVEHVGGTGPSCSSTECNPGFLTINIPSIIPDALAAYNQAFPEKISDMFEHQTAKGLPSTLALNEGKLSVPNQLDRRRQSKRTSIRRKDSVAHLLENPTPWITTPVKVLKEMLKDSHLTPEEIARKGEWMMTCAAARRRRIQARIEQIRQRDRSLELLRQSQASARRHQAELEADLKAKYAKLEQDERAKLVAERRQTGQLQRQAFALLQREKALNKLALLQNELDARDGNSGTHDDPQHSSTSQSATQAIVSSGGSSSTISELVEDEAKGDVQEELKPAVSITSIAASSIYRLWAALTTHDPSFQRIRRTAVGTYSAEPLTLEALRARIDTIMKWFNSLDDSTLAEITSGSSTTHDEESQQHESGEPLAKYLRLCTALRVAFKLVVFALNRAEDRARLWRWRYEALRSLQARRLHLAKTDALSDHGEIPIDSSGHGGSQAIAQGLMEVSVGDPLEKTRRRTVAYLLLCQQAASPHMTVIWERVQQKLLADKGVTHCTSSALTADVVTESLPESHSQPSMPADTADSLGDAVMLSRLTSCPASNESELSENPSQPSLQNTMSLDHPAMTHPDSDEHTHTSTSQPVVPDDGDVKSRVTPSRRRSPESRDSELLALHRRQVSRKGHQLRLQPQQGSPSHRDGTNRLENTTSLSHLADLTHLDPSWDLMQASPRKQQLSHTHSQADLNRTQNPRIPELPPITSLRLQPSPSAATLPRVVYIPKVVPSPSYSLPPLATAPHSTSLTLEGTLQHVSLQDESKSPKLWSNGNSALQKIANFHRNKINRVSFLKADEPVVISKSNLVPPSEEGLGYDPRLRYRLTAEARQELRPQELGQLPAEPTVGGPPSRPRRNRTLAGGALRLQRLILKSHGIPDEPIRAPSAEPISMNGATVPITQGKNNEDVTLSLFQRKI